MNRILYIILLVFLNSTSYSQGDQVMTLERPYTTSEIVVGAETELTIPIGVGMLNTINTCIATGGTVSSKYHVVLRYKDEYIKRYESVGNWPENPYLFEDYSLTFWASYVFGRWPILGRSPLYTLSIESGLTGNKGIYEDREVLPRGYQTSIWVNLTDALPEGVEIVLQLDLDFYYPSTGSEHVNELTYLGASGNPTNTFKWDFTQKAVSYDLEWVFIEDNSYAISNSEDAFLYKEGVRVNVSSTMYTHDMPYNGGVLYYRVRPVGEFRMGDGEYMQPMPGAWFYGTPVELGSSTQEENKNYSFQVQYAEDGKSKTVKKYMDGSMRERQILTNISTDNTVLISETYYDEMGRASIQTMPVPQSGSSFEYREGFTKVNTGPIQLSNYTNGNIPSLSNTSGSEQYYSSNNEFVGTDIFASAIPESEGYSYTMTRYMQDNTGRVKSQSGVGESFKMGGNHTQDMSYATPTSTELIRLFGPMNVGKASHYKKTYTKDANGQYSIQYLDQEGRVIASALAGESPEGLMELDPATQLTQTAVENLTDNQVLNRGDGTSRMQYSFYVPTSEEISFTYELDPASYITPECDEEKNIDYIFTAQITDEEGNVIAILGDDDIPMDEYVYAFRGLTGATTIHIRALLPHGGTYTVSKELRIDEYSNMVSLQNAFIECVTGGDPEGYLPTLAADHPIDSTKCDYTLEQRCNNDPTCISTAQTALWEDVTTETRHDEDGIGECERLLVELKKDIMPGGYLFITSDIAKANKIWKDETPPSGLSFWNSIFNNNTYHTYTNSTYADRLVEYHREYVHYEYCMSKYANRINPIKLEIAVDAYLEAGGTTVNTLITKLNEKNVLTMSSSGKLTDRLYSFKALIENVETGATVMHDIIYCSNEYKEELIEEQNTYRASQGLLPLDLAGERDVYKQILLSNITTANEESSKEYFEINENGGETLVYCIKDPLNMALPVHVERPEYLTEDGTYAEIEDLVATTLRQQMTECQVCQEMFDANLRNLIAKLYETYVSIPATGSILGIDRFMEIYKPILLNYPNSNTEVQRIRNLRQSCCSNNPMGLLAVNDLNRLFLTIIPPTTTVGYSEYMQLRNRLIVMTPEQKKALFEIEELEWTNIIQNDLHDFEYIDYDLSFPYPTQYILSPHFLAYLLIYYTLDAEKSVTTSIIPHSIDITNIPQETKKHNIFMKDNLSYMMHELSNIYACDGVARINSIVNFLRKFDVTGLTLRELTYIPDLSEPSVKYVISYNCGVDIPNDYDLFRNIYLLRRDWEKLFSSEVSWINFINTLNTTDLSYVCKAKTYYNNVTSAALINAYPDLNSLNNLEFTTTVLPFEKIVGDINGDGNIDNGHEISITEFIQDYFDPNVSGINNIESNGLNINYNSFVQNSEKTFKEFTRDLLLEYDYIGVDESNRVYFKKGDRKLYLISSINSASPPSLIFVNNPLLVSRFNIIPKSIEIVPDRACGGEQYSFLLDLELDDEHISHGPDIHFYEYQDESENDGDCLYVGCSNSEITGTDAIYLFNPVFPVEYEYLNTKLNEYIVPSEGVFGEFFIPLKIPKPVFTDRSGAFVFAQPLNVPTTEITVPGFPEVENDCIENLRALASLFAEGDYKERYEDYMTESLHDVLSNGLLSGDGFSENMYITTTKKEYQHTLYFYDQAGNLTKTVPPNGVKSKLEEIRTSSVFTSDGRLQESVSSTLWDEYDFETSYTYNSLNQITKQVTPDAGVSYYRYNLVGQIRVSQSAQQGFIDPVTNTTRVSYTNYDNLGRVQEVGEYILAPGISIGDLDIETDFATDFAMKLDVSKMYYDNVPEGHLFPRGFSADNLRSRVSYIEKAGIFGLDGSHTVIHNNTYYSYDAHGNVKSLLYERFDLGMYSASNKYKQINYEYDLLSGKVTKVIYQPDRTDQFIHTYEYDADNRIVSVATSAEGYVWEKDAEYKYYKHGPLARTIYGDKNYQSVDYTYTLQGWIKGINGDFGLSNLNNTTADGKVICPDMYNQEISYYAGDYKPIGNTGYTDRGYSSSNLYNGNIRGIYSTHAVLVEYGMGMGLTNSQTNYYGYRYDQLNRLRESVPNEYTENNATKYTYDANGNLKTLERKYKGTVVDNFIYNENDPLLDGKASNRLFWVSDIAPQRMPEDRDFAWGSTSYLYDKSGNLIDDGTVEISWTASGKVDKVRFKNPNAPVQNIWYNYDGMGNRITKTITYKTGDKKAEFYVYDAGGNMMAVYEIQKTAEGIGAVVLDEQYIYGSSRLGIRKSSIEDRYKKVGGNKYYEVSNHLGNVMMVFTNRFSVQSGSYADLQTQTSYYPFGMVMQEDRETDNVDAKYSRGFNGKEKVDELYGEGNAYDFGARMYDARIGRWIAVDPLPKPHESLYAAFANNPICNVDPDGRDSINFRQWMDSDGEVQINQTFIEDGKPGLVTYGYDEINDEWVHEYTPPVVVKGQAKPASTNQSNSSTSEMSTFQSIGYAMDMFYASITLPTPVTESESSVDAFANKYIGYPVGLGVYKVATFMAPMNYIETAATVLDDKMTGHGYGNTTKNLLMYAVPSKGKALPFSIFIQGLDYSIQLKDFYQNQSSRYNYVEQK